MLGFLDHVQIVEPPEARDAVIAAPGRVGGTPAMSRTDAPPQLERVLAMIPWLATHRDVPKAEVAERFGITVEQLDADLALIMMVGVPPYSPGDYINVTYDGDTVDLWLAPYFTAPLQLTAAEGLALLAGGRTLLAVPGSDPDGPLATAIGKLEDALGVTEVVVELASPPFLDDGARRGRRGTSDRGRVLEQRSRRVDDATHRPGSAVLRAGGVVHRRLLLAPRRDRGCSGSTASASVTPHRRDLPAGPTASPAPPVYHPRPDDPRVTIELPPRRELGHRERAGGVGRGARRRSPADRRARERTGVARADPAADRPGCRRGRPARVARHRSHARPHGCGRATSGAAAERGPERTLSRAGPGRCADALRWPVVAAPVRRRERMQRVNVDDAGGDPIAPASRLRSEPPPAARNPTTAACATSWSGA